MLREIKVFKMLLQVLKSFFIFHHLESLLSGNAKHTMFLLFIYLYKASLMLKLYAN